VATASPSAANAAEPKVDEIQAMLGGPGIMQACPTDQNVRWSRIFRFYLGWRYTVELPVRRGTTSGNRGTDVRRGLAIHLDADLTSVRSAFCSGRSETLPHRRHSLMAIGVGVGGGVLALVKGVDAAHLVLGQLEVEGLEVLPDPLRV